MGIHDSFFPAIVNDKMELDLYRTLRAYSQDHPIQGRLLSLPVVLIDTLAMPPTWVLALVQQIALTTIETIRLFYYNVCRDKSLIQDVSRSDARMHLRLACVSTLAVAILIPLAPLYGAATLAFALKDPANTQPGLNLVGRLLEKIPSKKEIL